MDAVARRDWVEVERLILNLERPGQQYVDLGILPKDTPESIYHLIFNHFSIPSSVYELSTGYIILRKGVPILVVGLNRCIPMYRYWLKRGSSPYKPIDLILSLQIFDPNLEEYLEQVRVLMVMCSVHTRVGSRSPLRLLFPDILRRLVTY
jgi:hypothetical protein